MLLQFLKRFFPGLKFKLKQAGISYDVKTFLKRTLIVSLYSTIGLSFVIFVMATTFQNNAFYILIPIIFLMSFFYFMKLPDVIIRKNERAIGSELVFAGRFLIIELESGVPMYNALINLSKNYNFIGKYFKQIIDKVNMGSTMEEAISEVIEETPSKNFRKLLWQILNSLKTGADISKSMNVVVEQITKEQMIEVKEYGRKLNPLAMFYMIMAVIIPTLGTTLLIIISSFVGIEVSLGALLALVLFLAFVQFMFMAIIRSSRPAVGF